MIFGSTLKGIYLITVLGEILNRGKQTMNWQIADNLHFSPWAHLNLFFVKDRGQAVETSWIVRETERE